MLKVISKLSVLFGCTIYEVHACNNHKLHCMHYENHTQLETTLLGIQAVWIDQIKPKVAQRPCKTADDQSFAMVSVVEVFRHALNRKSTPARAPERVSKVILLQGILYILIGKLYNVVGDVEVHLRLSQCKAYVIL